MIILAEMTALRRQIDRLTELAMECRERATCISLNYGGDRIQSSCINRAGLWVEAAVDYERQIQELRVELSSMIIDLRCIMIDLPETQQQIVGYVYIDGMTISDAAHSAGISERHARRLAKNFPENVPISVN